MTLKSKIKKLITTFAFDEIHESDKNDNVMRKSRFISSVIIDITFLRQVNAEVINAEVEINVEVINEETLTYFFAVFAD